MSTLLDRKIAEYESKHNVKLEILHKGVTGGAWYDFADAVAFKWERNNCAAWIRANYERVANQNAFVITGAKYGGRRGCKAKQYHYVIVTVAD